MPNLSWWVWSLSSSSVAVETLTKWTVKTQNLDRCQSSPTPFALACFWTRGQGRWVSGERRFRQAEHGDCEMSIKALLVGNKAFALGSGELTQGL